MSNPEAPLVPAAKPVYLDLRGREAPEPPDHQDSHPETKWHNPTDQVVKLTLFKGTPTATPGRPPRNWEERTGNVRYVFKPGETRSLPSEFDMAIQHTQCKEIECLQRPFDCRDPDHIKEIVGGLGPQLVNLGLQHRPTLHPSLDDEMARADAAKRKAFEAFQLQEAAAQDRARAQAEEARASEALRARTEADQKAAEVLKQHQPKNK